jgi:hypothetical protein
MTFNFYCVRCKVRFESDDWEFGRFGQDKKGSKKGRKKNYYVRALHECSAPNYRMLSRKERYAVRNDYADTRNVV